MYLFCAIGLFCGSTSVWHADLIKDLIRTLLPVCFFRVSQISRFTSLRWACVCQCTCRYTIQNIKRNIKKKRELNCQIYKQFLFGLCEYGMSHESAGTTVKVLCDNTDALCTNSFHSIWIYGNN